MKTAMTLTLLIATLAGAPAPAATPANTRSAVGINLNGVSYFSSEQPFLDIFKTNGPWSTDSQAIGNTDEVAYLQLDANGYPTTLKASAGNPHRPQLFDHVSTLLMRDLAPANGGSGPPYRPGMYVVLYDGQGTLNYSGDASLLRATPGRDLISVANPTSAGIGIHLMATDPKGNGNYLRNIRVAHATEETLLKGGAVFRPGFLALLQNFRALRFMDWLQTNDSNLVHWTDRPRIGLASWALPNGTPLEVAVQLCNETGADCWLNTPHQADDEYIREMAKLVRSRLGGHQDVYVELSNEVWNTSFKQFAYGVERGRALWPGVRASDYELNRSWYGMRTAQMCDLWQEAWGADFGRVHCVLGAQAANTWSATSALACPLWTGAGHAPCSAHHITEVAIAPYFDIETLPAAWGTQSRFVQLNNVFGELMWGGQVPGGYRGGALKRSADWEAAYAKAIAPYKLPLIAYEGGQSLVASPHYGRGSWGADLYRAANRDPRMGLAYSQALSDWKDNGGRLYMQFTDIATPTEYGEWGALESFLDDVTPARLAPPKWRALQEFIAANPCWWTGCAGTVDTAGADRAAR